MIETFSHMFIENQNDPTNNIAITISIFALLISIVGWFIVYILGLRATNIDRKNNFQLSIYLNILDKSNELIQLISAYNVSAKSHTSAMAKVLKEYRAYDNAPDSREKIEKTYELKKVWLDASYMVAEQGFDVQIAIENYMRFLDMNGTDFTRGTVVYSALHEVKNDAYNAIERDRKRWNDHREMDVLTSKDYTKMCNDAEQDADIILDFGLCIDDVLILIYNQSISRVLSKPIKQLNLSEPRRIITLNGILDNRKTHDTKKR